jgi:hypothetical protein
MTDTSIRLQRSTTILRPDQTRVLLRPFTPGDEHRIQAISARILAFGEEEVGRLLEEVTAEFSGRHQNIRKTFWERYEQIRCLLPAGIGRVV